jgi:hypothetical protein
MQWSFSVNNLGVRLSLQSWRWCLRCCSVVVSSKGMHKVEQNLSASFQAIWARATGRPGALLVSPFNMKWRFSAPAGGVEWSKFCLFSVVLPARCVSNVSPRFTLRGMLSASSLWPPSWNLSNIFLTNHLISVSQQLSKMFFWTFLQFFLGPSLTLVIVMRFF